MTTNTRRLRSLQMALITVLLCATMIAGGTYALFSDQATLKGHLSAGTLDVSLYRTNLVTETVDPNTGFLVTTEYKDDIDFTQNPTKNIFEVGQGVALVPECSYDAEMSIVNNGTVAFNYWIEIVFDDTNDLELADQIEITVVADTTKSVTLSAGLTIGDANAPIGTIAKGNSQTFHVIAKFVDNAANNDAQGQTVSFDLIVHAVQVTPAP